MAAKDENTLDSLKEELQSLQKQFSELAKSFKDAGVEKSSELTAKLEKELEKYQKRAWEKVQKAYDAGSAGVEEVSERVRQNPLGSVLIAFGAGYVLSKILRHMR